MQKKEKNNKNQAKITPLGARVLVEPNKGKKPKEKTDSGIYIPENNVNEKPEQGKVIAVGEGEYENGKLIPVRVKVGERIIFSKYGYDEVKIGEEEYFLVKEENILAVIK